MRVTIKSKKILSDIVVGLIEILLINLIAANYLEMRDDANRLQIENVITRHLIGALYCFLVGLLIEWETIVKIAKREILLHFSPLLLFGIITLAISCIAPATIIMQFGLCKPFPTSTGLLSFFIGPLAQSSLIQDILAVIAGCMIIRGITKKQSCG